ncbi:MAG: hypothetical protein JWL77_2752 [Chthonomonadaceae bacterium]|nr:hypothetical protein [Chthonomonadaceae bacterium]
MKQRALSRKKSLLHPFSLLLLGTVCLCAVARPVQAQTTSFSFDVNSPKNDPNEATTAVYQSTNDTVTFSVIGAGKLEMSYVYGSTGAAAGGAPQAFAFNAADLSTLTVDTSNVLTTVTPDQIKQGQNFANFGTFDWELQYAGSLDAGSFTTVFDYTAGLLTPDQLIAEIALSTSIGGTPVNAAIHLNGNGLSYKIGNDPDGGINPRVPVTPEGSSGMLLMVGLVPMAGIMVWKSRRLTS